MTNNLVELEKLVLPRMLFAFNAAASKPENATEVRDDNEGQAAEAWEPVAMFNCKEACVAVFTTAAPIAMAITANATTKTEIQ